MHTAPGHGSDDFITGMKYGLEIYAPVGPGGHFLDTVELFGGQRVFDANPSNRGGAQGTRPPVASRAVPAFVSALLALPQPGDLPGHVAVVHRDGRAIRAERMRTRTLRAAALEAIDNDVDMGAVVGTRSHLQHDREPSRLVHLAPARLGCADPGGRLHQVRRSAADAGAGRSRGRRVRHLRRRRVVRTADRGVHPRRPDLPGLRRHASSSASATSSTSGSTPARATRPSCRSARS